MVSIGAGGGTTAGGGGGTSGGGGGGVFSGPSTLVAPGGGTGVSYMVSSGPGMPPVEVHGGGQSVGAAAQTANPGPAGHTAGGPAGHVQAPQAARFHGHASPNVSHSPVHVFNHKLISEAWQGYQASYVWPGPEKVDANLAPLPSGRVDMNLFELPHVVFPDEKPGPKSVVDNTAGASGTMQLTQVTNENTTQDFGTSRNVEYSSRTVDERSVTLDSSQNKSITISQPQSHESNMNIDYSRTVNADFSTAPQHNTQVNVEEAARVVNLIFIDGQSASAAGMGTPIKSGVA